MTTNPVADSTPSEETVDTLRELAAARQLIGLEAMAERDGQGVKVLGPLGHRLIVNHTDRGYTYHEAQGSSGGRITRQEALGLLQATLSTEDCPRCGGDPDGVCRHQEGL